MIRVLLVEDNVDLLTSLALALEARFEVRTAADGREALKILRRPERIDVVVVDYMMPRLNGVELVSRLRRRARALPVIFISAHSDVAAAARSVGVRDYLIKPFSVEELAERIEQVTGGPESGSHSTPGGAPHPPDRADSDMGCSRPYA